MVKDQRHMWMMGLTSQKDLQYFSKKKSSDVKMMSSKSCRRRELDSIITVECEARRPRIFTCSKPKKNFNKKAIQPPQKQLFFGRVCFFRWKNVFLAKKSPNPLLWFTGSSGPNDTKGSHSKRFRDDTFGKEDVSRGFLFGKAPPREILGNKNDHNNQLEVPRSVDWCVVFDEEDVITRLRVRCVPGRNTKLSYEKKRWTQQDDDKMDRKLDGNAQGHPEEEKETFLNDDQ